MSSRKRKKLSRADKELRKFFSWWSPVRKFFAAAAVAVTLGAGGTCAYTHITSGRDLEGHERYAADVTSRYKELPRPERVTDLCLTPGNDLETITDSVVMYRTNMVRHAYTIAEDSRRDAGLCIRNIDGDQDLALESRIHMTGLEYGDVSGILRYPTSIDIVPRVPDIFPHDFDIDALTIGRAKIPRRYITEQLPDNDIPFKHYTVDMVRLVADGLLTSGDFEDGLNITIDAGLSINEVPDLDPATILSMSAYDSLPSHFLRYTVAEEDFPKDHRRIRDIRDAYEGDSTDILNMLDYALQYTDDTLEYCRPDNSNCPGGRYLHIPELIDQGGGVCAGYTELFVTLCRSFGIPARYIANNTFNTATGDISGRHAWAEVLLPIDDGTYRWVTVEPTWADNTEDPQSYINFTTPRYMYDISLDVLLDTADRGGTYGILNETSWDSTARPGGEEQEGDSCLDEEGCDGGVTEEGSPYIFIEVRLEDIED